MQLYTPYREDPKSSSLQPEEIDPACEFGSKYEQQFAEMWVAAYPELDLYSQYRLCDETKHYCDFCQLESKVIIEIDGGTYMRRGCGGRHGSGGNYRKDGIAAYRGFVVFRFTTNQIRDAHKNQDCSIFDTVVETIKLRRGL